MELLHQIGHNFKWNIQSYNDDEAGDGFILSPVNIDYNKLQSLPESVCKNSYFDAQLYLPGDAKGGLASYPYFPANIDPHFSTSDFDDLKEEIANRCVQLQQSKGFRAILIPVRYFEHEPTDFLARQRTHLVDPFLQAVGRLSDRATVLLTAILKGDTLKDREQRETMLDWLTGIPEIDGIYLIFDFAITSKQIKDPELLSEALYFIHALKQNELQVRVGYTNTEGLLFSLAMPDSISFGAYENLRSFGVMRFVTADSGVQHGPNARLYSSRLLQWVEKPYIDAIRSLYDDWSLLFPDSKYKPIMFQPDYKWHFTKPELYKHFFMEFSRQVRELPDGYLARKNHIVELVHAAINEYDKIQTKVLLNPDSDGSHLPHWINAISIFEKLVNDR